ncbi:ABC transporter permease [Gandjariella thermophila]|uniref:ABC transporter permease n=1 Tax=Gandjariella thermophila TaxID=1931992 RepID=A0A4D4J8E2_9PSEU|nr:ABC transporter permease [Gandjariella thermophila]GDY30143.1 ABC transporter permease [Gandjariella thermophila]
MSEPEPGSGRTVLLVARREFRTRVRSRSFAIGTGLIVVLLAGLVLMQSLLFGRSEHTTVGLAGQATALAAPLRSTAHTLGRDVDVQEVTGPAAGVEAVRSGRLDALVTGAPDALRVTVKDQLDGTVRAALVSIVQQQVLDAQFAEVGLDPKQVSQNVAAAGIRVTALEPADPQRGQRLALGFVTAFVLYFSLVFFGSAVAQGVVEEKSSRVVEVLLATVRPWQLLAGKVLGLGAVGLLQLLVIGAAGVGLATATHALPVPGAALGALGAGVLWYLLGYFLYATVFAAAGSLVSRQEDVQGVLTPIILVIAVAFVVGVNLLLRDPADPASTVLSLLPPFAPVLMPGRIAAGVAPAWQVLLAVLLALAAIAALTWLGGRIYAGAVLRTGARVRLRDALR